MTKRLGLVIHHHRPEVLDLAKRALHWCGNEVVACLPGADAELIGRRDLAVSEAEFGSGLDACLSLGGDGTMLRATGLVASHGVPVLGVNAGHLSYLAEVDPSDMEDALDQWAGNQLAIQRRMMVEVWAEPATAARSLSHRPGSDRVPLPGPRQWVGRALNEAVIDRSESGRAVEVAVAIGGQDFITYLADGLIIATPTGSTAYSLSAGGPIVEPAFKTLLLTPVAAHTVFNRPMVLAPDTEVRLTVEGHRSAVVSLDGRQVAELGPGRAVVCQASDVEASFLVRGVRDFHAVLKEKFGISDR